MKTITLFILACIVTVSSAQAQISKGKVLLGGNLGYSNSDIGSGNSNYKNRMFVISPSLGFVVKDNKVIGFSLSYGHSRYATDPSQNAVSNSYGAGIFERKYLPLGAGFYLYGEGKASFYYSKQDQTATPNKNVDKTTVAALSLFPGLTYAVSKKFHLEIALSNLLNLSYSTVKHDYSSSGGQMISKTNQLNFSANANPASDLALGFRILLGK